MFLFLLTLFVLLGTLFQYIIPPIEWAFQARFMLMPTLFCLVSLYVRFPIILFLAVVLGLVWDGFYGSVSIVGIRDPKFGLTIILYFLMGLAMQPMRSLVEQRRWLFPFVVTGGLFFCYLFWEYFFLSFNRGTISFSRELLMKMLSTSVLSLSLMPLALLLIDRLHRMFSIHQQSKY